MIPSQKLADMSTCHVAKDDAGLLDKWAAITADPHALAPLHVYAKSEYGWYIIVPQDDFAEKAKELREAGASTSLVRLLRALADDGFTLLCLDRDGEVLPEFPKFDW